MKISLRIPHEDPVDVCFDLILEANRLNIEKIPKINNLNRNSGSISGDGNDDETKITITTSLSSDWRKITTALSTGAHQYSTYIHQIAMYRIKLIDMLYNLKEHEIELIHCKGSEELEPYLKAAGCNTRIRSI